MNFFNVLFCIVVSSRHEHHGKTSNGTRSPSNQIEIIVAKTPEEKDNLERFDKLDFEAWNNRNWTL